MGKDSDRKTISETAASWVIRRDAGLSGPESAELGQWLAADARHEAAFGHYTRAWAMISRPLPAGGQDALARELQAREKRRRVRRMRVATAGALTAVAISLVLLWQWPRGGAGLPPPGALADSGQPASAHARRGLATVTSPERRLLGDGSVVEIKQGAVIDVRYDADARRVVLVKGEAHFQVRKGLSRPFVVVAGGIEVRAVGTAFAVGLGEKRMEVWVTEGQVAVEKPAETETGEQKPEAGGREPEAGERSSEAGGRAAGAGERAAGVGGREPGAGGSSSPVPCPLSPGVASGTEEPATVAGGQVPEMPASAPVPAPGKPVLVATLGVHERIVVETAPAPRAAAPVVTPVTPAEINERLAWRISWLEFSATPLSDAVELINRHSQLLPDGSASARLVLDESLSGLAGESVSGRFQTGDIAAFVRVLGVSMEIESERRGNEIVLRKK